MAIFAIGDLHLPGQDEKPMDVFGSHWDRHFETICEHWQGLVTQRDVVLIPGDISWAMQLENAMDDLRAISALPGMKLLLRGNHDYWWNSISRVRACLPEGMLALQNDALRVGGRVFCGTRGWTFPTAGNPLEGNDEKVYLRELLRLQMSLEAGMRLRQNDESLLVMLHFPPLLADGQRTGFTDLLERYPIGHVVYGHLHGKGIRNGFSGEKAGICYQLVSCDALNFCPVKVLE